MDKNFNDIIQAVANGNSKAFASLYESIYMKVYSIVFYYLNNTDDTESVVSDVFCILWERHEHLTEVKNFDSYLFVISKHESLRFIKNNRNNHISLDDLSRDPVETTSSPIDMVSEKELRKAIKQAIEKLPNRCREIFRLVRLEKKTHKEVSEIMNITVGTVEIQMNIAIKKLKAMLAPNYCFA